MLDGACRVDDVIEKAHACQMPAIAITDHGGMFGAVEFFKAATEKGIKPIIGCEVYIAPGSRKEKKAASARDAAYHLILLAKDEIGYKNLIQLVTEAQLTGFYYKPRIDKELLAEHAKGLIGLTACLKGEVPYKLVNAGIDQAKAALDEYRQIFAPGDFYLELQDHGIAAQRQVNRQFVQWAKEFKLPLVATNDVHYVERQDWEAHDCLICLQTQAQVSEEKRMRYEPEQFFLRTPAEMHELFAEVPEAIQNTLEVAEKCSFKFEFGKLRFPVYHPPENIPREKYIRQLVDAGIRDRYGDAPTAEVLTRVEHELQIIAKQGFVSYILIVWDFVHFAKSHGIPVGPGRGSAAGSLVAYALKITDIDPLRYGLFFERFLNPERVSPPDIDMDFCYNRRPEVIEYVRQKYGTDHVAQIITFGTLGAKMVVRDVGRVLGFSYGDCDRIAKMIPPDLNMTLDRALEMNPELKTAYQTEEPVQRIINLGKTLEGIARNASTHAAGVVISDGPLTSIVPLTTGTNPSDIVTQYSMNPLGDLGVLKMDFLGLKTLTVIKDCLDLIQDTTGQQIDINQIPVDDQKTFDMLMKANTIGLFQLESGGMRDLCRRIGIDSIEVINALIALYRPGPKQFIDDYIARKHGKVKVEYDHPALEPILKETYGIFVYQEQVMQAANVLAGYTLGGADLLRRAMGKKKPEEMEKQRVTFVKGCADTHKIPKAKAEKIFDTLAKFAGYGFNKAHSAAYAVVAYQTAYLKAHFPVEFMAALLSNELANTDKIQLFINECRHMKIEVLPPDVNESGVRFTVDQGRIRFGMAAIKNVGEIAVQNIITVRKAAGPFQSLANFCDRIDARVVNRKVVECLIKCGAFDVINPSRAQVWADMNYQLDRAATAQRDRESGQNALFDVAPVNTRKTSGQSPAVVWSQSDLLGFEKELLGFYVTGHPLTKFAEILRRYELASTAQLAQLPDGQAIRLGGLIGKLQPKLTKQNKPMAILSIEDLDGIVEVLVFPEAYAKCSSILTADAAVFITGTVSLKEDKPKIYADQIIPLTEVPKRFTKAVHIRLATNAANEEILTRIQTVLRAHTGPVPVMFCFIYPEGKLVFLEAHEHFSVTPESALVEELEAILGEDSVWLKVDAEKLAAKTASPRQNWSSERKTSAPQKNIFWDTGRPEKV